MELVWSLSVALLVTTMMGQMFLVQAASVDVSTPNSCLGLFQDGVSSSGFYNITTTTEDGEVASLPVYCDMDRNGGGWTRVFRHDYSTLLRSLPARGQRDANIDDPEALLYSIMSMLPNMKASTEAYEFMMEWPGSKFQKPFIWRQSDIGANNTVPDFFPISIPHQYNFIGLQVSPVVKAAYSCTPRSVGWGFAIMQNIPYIGLLWGPLNTPVYIAQLWMRPVRCHSSCASCRGPSSTDCLSCPTGQQLSSRGFCGVKPQLENLKASCADIARSTSATTNGETSILTPSGYQLSVTCDQSSFGGGWTRVFSHNVSARKQLADEDQMNANINTPNDPFYSIMYFIEEFRSRSSENAMPLEYMLQFSGSSAARQPLLWRQQSSPLTTQVPTGVEWIAPNPYTEPFVGLRVSPFRQATISGGNTTWSYAIMQRNYFSGRLNGPALPVPSVELFVRDGAGCHASCNGCTGPTHTSCLDCFTGSVLTNGQCSSPMSPSTPPADTSNPESDTDTNDSSVSNAATFDNNANSNSKSVGGSSASVMTTALIVGLVGGVLLVAALALIIRRHRESESAVYEINVYEEPTVTSEQEAAMPRQQAYEYDEIWEQLQPPTVESFSEPNPLMMAADSANQYPAMSYTTPMKF